MKKDNAIKKTNKDSKVILTRIDRKSDRRQEWRFELPLTAIVEGTLPNGEKFREETIVENISSGGAYFSIDSGVTLDSKLELIIELPKKVTGSEKTTLRLEGMAVRLEKLDKKQKTQGIALSFDEEFQFVSNDK
jgi:c-di-GMP-binding flagellar brake protein YcgR